MKKEIKISSPIIILLESQLPENIGFSARAMLNFGVRNLRLVNPKPKFNSKKMLSTSAGAIDSKKFNITFHSSLEDAIKDISFLFATTARKRDINKPIISPLEAAKKILSSSQKGAKTGILFGAEKSGLKNSDLVKADKIINISSNPDFGSVNLAMSVLVVSYEYYMQTIKIQNSFNSTQQMPANKEELLFFISRLIKMLSDRNFFSPKEKRKSMVNNIEAIFSRNNLTKQEINTLHGIITSLSKN